MEYLRKNSTHEWYSQIQHLDIHVCSFKYTCLFVTWNCLYIKIKIYLYIMKIYLKLGITYIFFINLQSYIVYLQKICYLHSHIIYLKFCLHTFYVWRKSKYNHIFYNNGKLSNKSYIISTDIGHLCYSLSIKMSVYVISGGQICNISNKWHKVYQIFVAYTFREILRFFWALLVHLFGCLESTTILETVSSIILQIRVWVMLKHYFLVPRTHIRKQNIFSCIPYLNFWHIKNMYFQYNI